MARQLIDAFKGSFEPERYEDTYRDALMQADRGEAEGRDDRAGRRGARRADDRPPGGAPREHRGVEGSGAAGRRWRGPQRPKRKPAAKRRPRSRS